MSNGLLNGAFLIAAAQLIIILKNVNGSTTGAFGPTFRFRDRPDMVPVINNLHTKWYIDAVDALVGAYAKRTLKQATKFSQLSHARCVRTAAEITGKAKCLLKEITRQEQQKKLKNSLNLFRRRHRRIRMKRKVDSQKVMDYDSRKGHDLINAYKHGFLTGALRQTSEQNSGTVHSPLQALSTLVINAYRGEEELSQRDNFTTTLSKLNSLHGLLSNQLPARTSSTALESHRDTRKLSSLQSSVAHSPARVFSSQKATLINGKTFKPKAFPIKMMRLHSLGEISPLDSIISRTWTANGNFAETFSPRFAPLFRKSSKLQNRFLSPSILSFYRDPAVDNIASIPEMMDKVGMPANDQEALLEMILELSGASKTINNIFEAVNRKSGEPEKLNLDQQVADATERIETVWADVYRSFSLQQNLDFENDGYTFLRRDQLEQLYGANGLYRNSTTFNLDLDDYEKWTDKDRDKFLKRAVRKLASNGIQMEHRRAKRTSSRNNSKVVLRRGKRQYSSLQKQSTSPSRSAVHANKWKPQHPYFDWIAPDVSSENEITGAERQSAEAEENDSSMARKEEADAEMKDTEEQVKERGEETGEGSNAGEVEETEKESGAEDEKDAEGDKDNEEKDSAEEEDEEEEEEEEEKEEEEKEDDGDDTTLEPFAFVVSNLQPSVLGPVTLSPNIFSPANLSPALLGPTILSPSLGNPSILSPYVLSPVILSPSFLAPGVLSPYALSPNIINFVVLCPNILSPYILSPDFLSPSLFSPNIFSPFALSPSFFSDDILKNDTFDGSPDIFSPNILSK